MVMLITAPLGAKAQVTLPKAVRKALHLQDRQDMVGFIIQNGRVALTRIEPVPSRDPFTDQEWRAIDRLADQRPAAAPSGAEASLRYLQRHLRRR
ncbi:MAG: hypothetical protein A3D28_03795 [Omnitrophica bacterium RIFCSPHIGHO2_02_FULL_63_14]|nr:MAG: hypothetical protein A3D28_03795 [Omnitrophica bacterium RIFCSPHIGHO2_02_FULL_63_14]